MNTMLRHIFLTIVCCIPLVTLNAQVTAENCGEISAVQGWPSYYCDCKFNYLDFSLPLDIEISDSTWFKASLRDLSQGLSAYLYSDCNMSFDVFVACTNEEPKYQKEFTSNQTNSIDGQTIKERLEEYGYADGTFYICIAPIYGFGGRLLVNTQDQGFHTSCDTPLYILPGMSLYSTNATDIYALSPNDIPYGEDVIIHWQGDHNTPSQLTITSYTCDGDLVDELTLDASHPCYTFSAERIDQAWSDDEVFYLQFSHESNTAGFVHCLTPEFTAVYHDTAICQGMGIQLSDTILTQTTTDYPFDTVFQSINQYTINYLRLTVTEPNPQPDTLAFRYSQQPYLYRGQHTISQLGDYDLTIHTPGQCDERYLLHVYHDCDTLINVVDTLLCYGSRFEYQGKLYSQDASIGQSSWKNLDTLLVDSIHVRFITTPDIIHDTIVQNQYKYGKTYKQPGEFRFTYTNPNTFCIDSIILLVKPDDDLNIQYEYYYIDTTLCQGMVYEDIYGNEYTTSTVLYDTIPRVMNKYYEVEITTITFTIPETHYDTLSLKTPQLPYIYRGQYQVNTFGMHDVLISLPGSCDERYQLYVHHDIDTTSHFQDTTLCQGQIYVYDGVEYVSDTLLLDTLQCDPDTYQIWTIHVSFTVPETHYDTLSLKTPQLPYIYRGQYQVNAFGMHDVLISTPSSCDERYQLYVHHEIDTTYHFLDTTFCQGWIYVYNGVEYASNTILLDTLQQDPDTCQIWTINISFTEPDIYHDTLSLKMTNLPYIYRDQYLVNTFGLHDVLISTPDRCDERYLLHVYHQVDTLTQTIDTVLCQGRIYVYSKELLIQSDTIFLDSIQLNADTFCITSVNVQFTEPETQNETLYLKTTDLPYTYRNQCVIPEGGLDKDYDVLIHTADECDERYLLHVYHKIDTLRHTIDTLLCQGKFFEYEGKQYTSDTTFVKKLLLDDDTYQITTINLSFLEPEQQYISLPLKYSNLPYTYCGLTDTITAFGDYDLTIHTPGECDERHLVHAYHKMDTIRQIVDSAVCGIDFSYEDKYYTEDKTFVTYLPYNQDTVIANVLNVYFTSEKEERYQTLILKPSQLPYTYNLPDFTTRKITHFGDFDIEYTNTTTWCDVHLHLHVQPLIDTLYQSLDTTFCLGVIYLYRNTLTITSDTTFTDTLQRDADTYVITSVSVTFTAPEAIPDTLALKQAALPYLYRGQETITTFGDYDLTIRTFGECDERYLLHVCHDIDTLYTNIDTTLCEGRIFTYKEVEYTQPAILLDSNWLNMDTWQITAIDIAFTTPDMEYDTIVVKTEELLAGYYYKPADTMVYAAGDYFYEILTYNDCTRHLTLTVNEELTSAVDNLPCTEQPRLIMRNGVVYIIRGKECFTILGMKIDNNKITTDIE